jgi:hypothetical protein
MLVQFGALSSQRQTDSAKFSMPVFSPKLIYSAVTVRGWWIPRWLETQPIESVRNVLKDLLSMIGEGCPAVDRGIEVLFMTNSEHLRQASGVYLQEEELMDHNESVRKFEHLMLKQADHAHEAA